MSNKNTELGRKIKAARVAKGLSQSELAEKCEVSSSAIISNWENGNNFPDVDKLSKLCIALDVSLSYMFDYYSDKSRDLSPDEWEIIQNFRLLSDEDQKQVLDLVNTLKEKMIQDAKGYTVITPFSITQPVFLTREDANYTEMKMKCKNLNSMRIEKNVSLERITRFLWEIGYGENICLGYVIGIFKFGTHVPNQQLYDRLKKYLEGRYRITIEGDE